MAIGTATLVVGVMLLIISITKDNVTTVDTGPDSTYVENVKETLLNTYPKEEKYFPMWKTYDSIFTDKILKRKPYYLYEECGIAPGVLVKAEQVKYTKKYPGYDSNSFDYYKYYIFTVISPTGKIETIELRTDDTTRNGINVGNGYKYYRMMNKGDLILDSNLVKAYNQYKSN